MAKDQYVARLRDVPLFSAMSKKEIALLLRQADNIRFPPSYPVVREGREGEEFWLARRLRELDLKDSAVRAGVRETDVTRLETTVKV